MKENMMKLLGQLSKVTNEELERANDKYRLFESDHEAYAILREELDEFSEAFKWVEAYQECPWESIKRDDTDETYERTLKLHKYLMLAVAEGVQATAMCRKLILSQKERADE